MVFVTVGLVSGDELAGSLEELQEYVGGFIELVRVLGPSHTPEQMIVNEEGHLENLELNQVATDHYHRLTLKTRGFRPGHPIVGPAVLLEGSEVHLD